jgi:Myb-like DNA-binding domain
VQDVLLLEAVGKHGKVWSQIVKVYFPGRTGLSAKNRYDMLILHIFAIYYDLRVETATTASHSSIEVARGEQ